MDSITRGDLTVGVSDGNVGIQVEVVLRGCTSRSALINRVKFLWT